MSFFAALKRALFGARDKNAAAAAPASAAPAAAKAPAAASAGAPQRMAAVRNLIASGLLTPAAQPRNNALNLDDAALQRLYVFLIDHDYPGGSAAMHNAVFAKLGLPYRSCFMIGDPANVAAIMQGLKSEPLYFGGGAGSGFKDKISPSLEALDQSAQTIGSVNVVAKRDGKLTGFNTDGIGFVNGLLAEYPNCIAGRKIVVLGAGGTALPISYELSKRSPSEIVIVNRTVAKAQQIADLVKPYAPARAVGEEAMGDVLDGAGLIVNTSNKGAQPNEKFSAFAAMTGNVEGDMAQSLANLARVPADAIVADILLEALPLTLKLAAERGLRTHSGRSMNLHQAVPAFKMLTGVDAPDGELLPVMQQALA
jgi:shikimate dehydrogenase